MASSPCSSQTLCWLPANSVTLSTDCLGTPENRKEVEKEVEPWLWTQVRVTVKNSFDLHFVF